MSYEAVIGLCGFLGMLIMIMVGIPIFTSMLVAALIGFWLIGGPTAALTQFTNGPYNIAASYSFSVLPMFLLMGVLAGESDIAEGAYSAARKWVGRLRGGLLMATIGGNAVFGACSGISVAGSVVFGKIALPELEKYGYDKRTSLGCITAAGALSSLIPPSMPILIFCILTGTSVGRALMAGIGPGILTAVLLCVSVAIFGIVSPERIPRTDIEVSWRERISTLTLLLPIAVLFLIVIGGSFAGVFPATVGGAIGSSGVLIYALARRIDRRRIARCFWESATMNAQLFPIIVAGFLFSRFISLSGLAEAFSNAITSIQMPPLGVMAIVIVFYIFCGMVMDIASILIITLPIVFPLLTGIGFSPYALVVILVFMGEIAGLTPPIGMNVFVVSSLARVDPGIVFKGVFPFLFVELAMVVILVLFPGVATFLPNLFYK